MTMTTRRLFVRAAALLLLAAACDAPLDPIATPPTLAAGVYKLVSVNGGPLPFTVPSTGQVWRSGQWTVSADGSFSASFDAPAGTIPKTVEMAGVVKPLNALSALVVFSDGSESTAVLTSGGFRVPVGIVTLGLSH